MEKPDNKALVEKLLNQLKQFQATGQPFVIFFQPGAGAPVQNYISLWMSENLGGCTGELCAISGLDIQRVVINSMNANEQASANAKILVDKKTDVSNTPIFNDPDCVFAIIFEIASELKTVNERVAYLPHAVVCSSEGVVMASIENTPKISGQARDSKEYLAEILASVGTAKVATQSSTSVVLGMFGNKKQKIDEDKQSSQDQPKI
ncbi:MAG: hypothetical protein WC627_13160 [Legionella sp.]|jgi:hypothetical protein